MLTRTQKWDRLKANPNASVLVIGAGINGIGTFRDLAHQGVDVVLVDKADYGSGASAASSHMLHGGIRYLENGEFRLVREALTERNLMLRNAPHYSKPLLTSIPIFNLFSGLFNAPLKFLRLREKPSERGALVIKIGLIFYDWFARSYRVMPTHRMLGRSEALKTYPGLREDVKYVAQYYDAYMPNPERICVELVQEAERVSEQAIALNYVQVTGATKDKVSLRDDLTGETLEITPKLVVNAAGPWIDFTMQAMGMETKFIGGTKGSHLILDHPELYRACNGGEFFFENKDGRIVLILPYINGRVMVGTTDIRIDDPEKAVCTPEETRYMLELVNRILPGITVGEEHIVFKFSGVRPLPTADKGYTGNVSRDHSIKVTEPDGVVAFPTLSLVGGKWTTYRAFSEQTADRVLERLGRQRKVSTTHIAIGGGRDYPTDEDEWINHLEAETHLDRDRLRTLFERYGTTAREVAGFMADGDDAPLRFHPGYTRREIEWIAATEQVIHLDDLVLRRTVMAWLGGFTRDLLTEVGGIVASVAGWDSDRAAAEIERAAVILKDRHDVVV